MVKTLYDEKLARKVAKEAAFQKTIEIAKKLLKMGVSTIQISESTELSEKEIKKLQKEINEN